MSINLDGINYLAVALAAVAAFMIGGVWYTALFGKAWQRLNGYSDEKVKEMQARRPPPVFFGVMLTCYFIVAFILAVLFNSFGVASASTGMIIGFLAWLGLAAAIGMTSHIASDKPIGVYLIDTTYQLIFLVLMGGILGGWR